MMFRVLSSPYVREDRNAYLPSLVNAKSCDRIVSGRTMRFTIESVAVSIMMTWLLCVPGLRPGSNSFGADTQRYLPSGVMRAWWMKVISGLVICLISFLVVQSYTNT